MSSPLEQELLTLQEHKSSALEQEFLTLLEHMSSPLKQELPTFWSTIVHPWSPAPGVNSCAPEE
jgi:hypothetical protein